MGIFDKLKFAWDDVGAISSAIDEWSPKGCRTEKDFEKDLYAFLHDTLPGIQVTKQHSRGRFAADIVVGERVIVEMKLNLDSTSKLQRLFGQLDLYAKWEGRVVVLLLGETEPNLRKELKARLAEMNEHDWDVDDRFTLVEKAQR